MTSEEMVVVDQEGVASGSFCGSPFSVLLPSSWGSGGCSVLRLSLAAGQHFPDIALASELGIYVLSGNFSVQAGCNPTALSTGGFVHVAADVATRMAGGEGGCEILLLAFPGGLDAFFMAGSDGPPAKRMAIAAEAAVPHGIQFPPNGILFDAVPIMAVPPVGEDIAFSLKGCVYRPLIDPLHSGFSLLLVTVFPGGELPSMWGAADRFLHGISGSVELSPSDCAARGRRIVAGETALMVAGVPGGFIHDGGEGVAECLLGIVPSDLGRLLVAAGHARGWDDQSTPEIKEDNGGLAESLTRGKWQLS